MCHALIKVKYRVGEVATVTAETPDELADREAKLRASDETLEYRVYVAQAKNVRVSSWEVMP